MGWCSCRHHHCKCSFGVCWVLPAITTHIADSATVRKVLVNFLSVHKQLPQAMMPMFGDEGVLHTVTDMLRQTRSRTSKGNLEGFIMRSSYCVVLIATLHQWEWPGRCHNRSRHLWEENRGSGGHAVERRTVSRGDGGSIPPAAISKLRQFLHPTFASVFRKRH